MSTSEQHIEQRIKEAFDDLRMPPGLKESTLAIIEEKTCEFEGSNFDPQTPNNALEKAHIAPKYTRRSFTRKMSFAIAACVLVFALGFGGFSAYATETAVVGIEVNPSIELGGNRFDIVVAARALNEDAELVLENVSVIGKSSEEALELITQNDAFMTYINEEAYVDIYIVCSDERQSTILVDQGQARISALSAVGSCSRVSAEVYSEAVAYEMGVGRYEAARVLVSLDPSLAIEDCRSMSMQEMRRRIAEVDPENEYAWRSGGNQGGQGGQGGQGQYGSQNGKNRQ